MFHREKIALLQACEQGHWFAVEEIVKNDCDNFLETVIDCQNIDGHTPLIVSLVKKHDQIARFLIDKNASLEKADHEGFTPLMWAIYLNNYEIVSLLLGKNVFVNAQDCNGYTALMWASAQNHEKIVELLLRSDAHVNMIANRGKTALMLASRHGCHSIVEMLLNSKASVNIQDNEGYTALTMAVIGKYPYIVRLLIQHGAFVETRDLHNHTALYFAGKYPIVQYLLDANAVVEIEHFEFKREKEVSLLLREFPVLDETVLLEALEYNLSLRLIETMILQNPSFLNKPCNGLTPLQNAYVAKRDDVIEMLFKHGANVHANNREWKRIFNSFIVSFKTENRIRRALTLGFVAPKKIMPLVPIVSLDRTLRLV